MTVFAAPSPDATVCRLYRDVSEPDMRSARNPPDEDVVHL
ncbi:MAG: hypothetical protein QOJ39_838 [Candidatus Eremiobacteraeota bacterium]|jgi:hypothetical protein|nr:hypothetical protein [Candidatus Eremiobacteraeota bacterium]